MQRHLLLLSLAALAAQPAFCRTLSPEEALNRASVQVRKVAPKASKSRVSATPIMTFGDADSPAIYVFNNADSGYVFVSANDVAAPLLGYTDSANLDPENIPSNLRGWLENTADQINRAVYEGAETYFDTNESDFAPIEPLVSAKWDQTAPFNQYCPTRNGFRCVTGCVATAMAQVMKYFNWPEQAADDANISYTWRSGGQTLTADFSNYKFDWDNMLDSYRGSYTEAQGQAVAKLMQACGYGVDMDYNLASSGSAAFNTVAGKALARYFKYDRALHNEPRALYSDAQWQQLIYENLRDCGPVIYWGGIHCFVCDGYQGNGYFHFNWGWAGDGDGYFLLDALNPKTVGTGGSAVGYNNDQGALLGIKPAVEGQQSEIGYTFIAEEISSLKTTGTFLYLYGVFTNYSPYTVQATFAYKIYSEDGNDYVATVNCTTPTAGSTFSPDLRNFSLLGSISSSVTKDNVTYRIYPAVIVDGKEYPLQTPPSVPGYVIYTRKVVGGQKEYIAELPDVGHKEILDLSTNGDLYVGQARIMVSGIAKFTGDATTSEKLTWRLLNPEDNSKVVITGDEFTVKFTPEGNAFNVACQWLNNLEITPGEYTFALSYYDAVANGMKNRATCPVTVKAQEASAYKATSFTVDNALAVDPENIRLSATIEGESGYAYEDLYFEIYNDEDYCVWGPEAAPLYVTAGNTATVSTTAKLSSAQPGDEFIARLYKLDKGSKSYLLTDAPFTIAKDNSDTSGILDVNASLSAEPAIYDLQGRKVTRPTIGLYIVNGKKTLIK